MRCSDASCYVLFSRGINCYSFSFLLEEEIWNVDLEFVALFWYLKLMQVSMHVNFDFEHGLLLVLKSLKLCSSF